MNKSLIPSPKFDKVPAVSVLSTLIAVVAVLAPTISAQESKPKWIIAHKINQAIGDEYSRDIVWLLNPPWYPACFGQLGNNGTEDSLDHFFDPNGNYLHANGLEFDVWYNEPGDDISDYQFFGCQEDIFGNCVSEGQWYVSHEPCDDEHVPLHAYVDYLRSRLDIFPNRVAFLYVDIKAPLNHTGNFDPIGVAQQFQSLITTVRSELEGHYQNINVLYSTAEWTDRGAFLQDNLAGFLLENELLGIDEDNDDAFGDDTQAANVARDWFVDSRIGNVYLSDDTDATRQQFVALKDQNNYPQIVGGWTVSSGFGTDAASNSDALEFWNEGVNLFLVENFYETGDGTGAYAFLNQLIANDPNSHLATGADRPWLPKVEINSTTSDGQVIEFNTNFSHAVAGLPIQVEGVASNNIGLGGFFEFDWGNGQQSSGGFLADGHINGTITYASAGLYEIELLINSAFHGSSTQTTTTEIQVRELDESVQLVADGLTAAANNPAEPPEIVELLEAAVDELGNSGGVLDLLDQSLWHPACQKLSNAIQLVHEASLLTTNAGLPFARKQLTRCAKAIAIRALSDAIANGLDEGQAMFVNNIILQGTLLLADDMDLAALSEFCSATETLAVGDVNGDGSVDLLDVAPFVQVLSEGDFVGVADINRDGIVNLLDVAPFVALLAG